MNVNFTEAKLAHTKLEKIRRGISKTKEQISRYPAELTRLKSSVIPDLESCIENNIDPKRAFCMKTIELFNSIDAFPLDLDFVSIFHQICRN